ncbi:NnrU family protein [Pelagerythrobacter rhizovicinus]|uniref:MFS transporter n=1 Tax=Pelagerythrobacter rhizovicinus TaxID=2268576 RepID=A0A4Q2KJQ6_9SPHN|nr:NnrU family protein [Pelagerythrobacter rhizovicinus]RXZ64609.1 MFS transporter [Pelagerythrobacter rhizovicinus]
MNEALLSLSAAAIAFVGTHFALSHPLRAPLVRAVGAGPFLVIYSLVALATFVWMVLAFRAAPPADLGGSGQIGWIVATVLTLPALVLFLGSLRKNPALPDPRAEAMTSRAAGGVFAVTRHPMMWGFALWAISHIALWWSVRTLIVAGSVLFLALVGAHMQDRKKRALMGEAWTAWEARTTYWPRWTALPRAGWRLWLVALVLWLVITWSHIHAAGIPAGVWLWIG